MRETDKTTNSNTDRWDVNRDSSNQRESRECYNEHRASREVEASQQPQVAVQRSLREKERDVDGESDKDKDADRVKQRQCVTWHTRQEHVQKKQTYR